MGFVPDAPAIAPPKSGRFVPDAPTVPSAPTPSLAGRASSFLRKFFKSAATPEGAYNSATAPITKPLETGGRIIRDNPEGAIEAIPAAAVGLSSIPLAMTGVGAVPAAAALASIGGAGAYARQGMRESRGLPPVVEGRHPIMSYIFGGDSNLAKLPPKVRDILLEAGASGMPEIGGAMAGKVAGGIADATDSVFNGVAKPAYRVFASKMKGVPRDIVENVFDAPAGSASTAAEGARGVLERVGAIQRVADSSLANTEKAGAASVSAAENLPLTAEQTAIQKANAIDLSPHESAIAAARGKPVTGPVPSEVADSAAKFSESFDDGISKSYDAVMKKASPAKIVPTNDLIGVANDLERSHMVGDVVVGKQSKDAVAAINEWKDALLRLTGPDAAGIPEPVALDLLKKLGKNTSWDGVSSKESVSALRSLRAGWRNVLAENNPGLGDALKDVSTKINAKEAFDDSFGLAYKPGVGMRPTDSTYTAVDAVARGKRPVSAEAGSAIPGFREGMAGASGRLSQEAQKEAEIVASEAAFKSASKEKGSAVSEAEKALRAAEAQKAQVVKDVGRTASRANMTATKFANLPRPDLLQIRTSAEAAARAGRGSPQEQALVEMLSPYVGREAQDVAGEIITGASKELFSRRPGATVTGRVGAKLLSPEAESFVKGLGASIRGGAAPVGDALPAVIRAIFHQQESK